MVAGGNKTYTCKGCGKEFRGWESAERIFCGAKCARPHLGLKTHGESYTRLHQIWCGMKTRCFCETSKVYPYYGGRGIVVYEEWKNNYEAFRDWAMSHGYRDNLEIERIDVNGNYEPGNCRWATRSEQMRNTRKRSDAKTSKFKGVSRHSQNKTWIAQSADGRKTLNLGSFRCELHAALAYDDFVFSRYPLARLNFPERKRPLIQGRKVGDSC